MAIARQHRLGRQTKVMTRCVVELRILHAVRIQASGDVNPLIDSKCSGASISTFYFRVSYGILQ